MCDCRTLPELIDITNRYSSFTKELDQIDSGDWILLMQCKSCKQMYRVDVWDKLQTIYALKITSEENWKTAKSENLIKERIIQNRGGITEDNCVWKDCDEKQVEGSAFCVNHIYSSGVRS